jgi:4-hydroxy-tetrahydrodipicolinate reductase
MSKIGVVGAGGQLGGHITAAAGALGVEVCLTATSAGWTGLVPDVVIDASSPAALADVLTYVAQHQTPLVTVVSGYRANERDALGAAAERVPVLVAPNLSAGHHLQKELVATLLRKSTSTLPGGAIGVTDRHPPNKRDLPSASALALRDCLYAAGANSVDVWSTRVGMPVCEHEVSIATDCEEIVIAHRVRDWSAYGEIAVRSAVWLAGIATPGLHTIDEFHAWKDKNLANCAPSVEVVAT